MFWSFEIPFKTGFTVHTYTYIHTHIHTHIHTYIRTYIRTHAHTHVRTHARTYVRTYILTYVRTYIHTYMHTYIYVGIQGNEIAETLAKEAATNTDIKECYKKVPKSVAINELSAISAEKWQTERDQTTKGKITKEYFPVVADRLNMRINITHNFTSMVTGHGTIRSYLHRLKIIETPTCPCGTKEQTIDHLLFECIQYLSVYSIKDRHLANK